MTAFTINKSYNFSVYANSVLGTNYRNVKLASILDYHTAMKFANIELLHRQIYPYLPPNTLQDQTKYTYYLFKTDTKDIVLADVWINANSVEETEGLNYTLQLNNITSAQLAIIRDQLRLLGISFNVI